MSAVGKLKQTVGRAIDWLVGVMSGSVPMRSLEGQNAYRVTVGLVVIGLGLGGWLIWRTIQTTVSTPIAQTSDTTPIAELEKLRDKDTDGDGLSDYVELFNVQTSPYLSDSDSDGISDAQEVATQGNPNCPTGQICNTAGVVSAGSDSSVSPAFLRQALKASGVPQTTLDALSDEDVVRIYGEAATQVPPGNTNTAATPSLDALESLTPAEIRDLLRDAGIDEATLSQVDDAALKEIFKQAIASE